MSVSAYLSGALILISGIALSGCYSSGQADYAQQAKRTSLGDLANKRSSETVASVEMSQTQRSAKLANIYQQLLTLEPDPEIRTHVEYRLAQINTESFETQSYTDLDDESQPDSQVLAQLTQNDAALQKLVNEYQQLLQRYPKRPENEHIQYQLAKALDLQGKLDASLAEVESLLRHYPQTMYLAELNFRRGEIYYNLQNYSAAITAYQQVLTANDNQKYQLNSLYMLGWSEFKLNRLANADKAFLQVFEALVAGQQSNRDVANLTSDNFAFEKLGSRAQNLAIDTQRVLSISLSQQLQSQSLVSLVNANQSLPNINLYQHVLFANLAQFLLDKKLDHDAELTYQAYIDLASDNIWAARYSLDLLDLYQRQGKFAAMHQLKNDYVNQYGLSSTFWVNASTAQQAELLPQLLSFSDEHSRRLYADAQTQQGAQRISAFAQAASALKTYLQLAKLPQASTLLTKDILNDEYLFADANFEAKQYQQALASYYAIAYDTTATSAALRKIQQQSAYATTVTIREIISQHDQSQQGQNQQKQSGQSNTDDYNKLISQRNQLDKDFINQYPSDERALQLASNAAQYSFDAKNYTDLKYFTDFVLQAHDIHTINNAVSSVQTATPLSDSARKQVQFVSQLYANSLYQQEQYAQAEEGYILALQYTDKSTGSWSEMRNLLASSIYFQAQAVKQTQPELAVSQLLRVAQAVPESKYAVNAELDAANLLLEQQRWQEAVDVLKPFQQRNPDHQFSAAIPAKLAQSYEALAQWDLAAEQLLIIVAKEDSGALKREALYTAAEYYLKAGDNSNALSTFRTYAKTYPQPFDVAQEVRFKMSEFYRQNGEANKQYYWFRQILSFDRKQLQQDANAIQARQIELASIAAFSLGQAEQRSFAAIKLDAPLQKSLKRKQEAMKKAIGYYQQVLDFQLAKFVPHATYNLAEMYRQLATDMMSSQRPGDLDELALEEYEILLEELAYPFEEKAIEIHISNTQRAWDDIYDQWIEKSFERLAQMSPALYQKQELTHEVIDAIH
ncbi:tetratricopeptide repeat protein [Shewanella sp. AC91-MNA-CIBAN-0169]|uniref:tetratricopeptide repeat protein n=1 Tax=Shewanella sp. AC91-MNA-CIBAN-0169 TaxID=3140466 RepID=UPI00332C4B42